MAESYSNVISLNVIWSIPFPNLLKTPPLLYHSPYFSFVYSPWALEMCISEVDSDRYIHVGLSRSFPNVPIKVEASVCVKTSIKERDLEEDFTFLLDKNGQVFSEYVKYVSITQLFRRRTGLLPTDTLTLFFTLKCLTQEPEPFGIHIPDYSELPKEVFEHFGKVTNIVTEKSKNGSLITHEEDVKSAEDLPPDNVPEHDVSDE